MSISDQSNERTFVRFDPDGRFVWESHTGLTVLDDDELDTAYERAHSFILKQLDDLVIRHAWREADDKEENLLLSLFPPDKRERPIWNLIWSFELPITFSDFINYSNPGAWGQAFDAIQVKRSNGDSDDLAISDPEPLANILYVIQSIAPGLVTLVGVTTSDDEEKECARGIPPTNWLLRHAAMLTEILGSKQAYYRILSFSKDPIKSVKHTTTPLDFAQYEEESFDDYSCEDDNNYAYSAYGAPSRNDFAACSIDWLSWQ